MDLKYVIRTDRIPLLPYLVVFTLGTISSEKFLVLYPWFSLHTSEVVARARTSEAALASLAAAAASRAVI